MGGKLVSTEKITIEREYITVSGFIILSIAVKFLFDTILFSSSVKALYFST